jgi:hypothetical protein
MAPVCKAKAGFPDKEYHPPRIPACHFRNSGNDTLRQKPTSYISRRREEQGLLETTKEKEANDEN